MRDLSLPLPMTIEVGPELLIAFARGLDYYQPTMKGVTLAMECGDCEASISNLRLIMSKLGRPDRIDRREDGSVLAYFAGACPEDDACYLATGLDIHHLAMLAKEAGFSECDERDIATVRGILYSRHSVPLA